MAEHNRTAVVIVTVIVDVAMTSAQVHNHVYASTLIVISQFSIQSRRFPSLKQAADMRESHVEGSVVVVEVAVAMRTPTHPCQS